jgi:hypothetical protein
MKKMQPQNPRGSKQKHPMKKEVTPNTQGDKNKMSSQTENQELLAHRSQLH